MPNTLAHICIQSLLSRSVIRDADPKWIYFGCVIPDIPWIVQRMVLFITPGIDPYALRFYLDVQASLFGSLILCAAVSLLFAKKRKMFALLGLNVFIHLLLDASQTKWANGVHLWAPFSWKLTNWGLFWPESAVNYLLTAAGLVYFFITWRIGIRRSFGFSRPSGRHMNGFIILSALYFVLPFFFLQGPEKADNHYLTTLRDPASRVGRYIEFDRAYCRPADEGVQCTNSDVIRVTGLALQAPARVSLRGTFVTTHEFRASESHLHLPGFRDSASYLGLTMIAVLWITSWIKSNRSFST